MYRVRIATPVYGGAVEYEYHRTVLRLLYHYGVEQVRSLEATSIDGHMLASQDLVRTRSAMVRDFLATDATHMLFVDSDISFEPELLGQMLAMKEDFVGCTYARKYLNYAKGEAAVRNGLRLEDGLFDYVYINTDEQSEQTITPEEFNKRPLIEMAGVGLGCVLLSRECLKRMVAACPKELLYKDQTAGDAITAALFMLMIEDHHLLSEDYSFCKRWRALGGKVWMYAGPLSPVTHTGAIHLKATTRGFLTPR